MSARGNLRLLRFFLSAHSSILSITSAADDDDEDDDSSDELIRRRIRARETESEVEAKFKA